jgi:hypothetical protein
MDEMHKKKQNSQKDSRKTPPSASRGDQKKLRKHGKAEEEDDALALFNTLSKEQKMELFKQSTEYREFLSSKNVSVLHSKLPMKKIANLSNTK